MSALDWRLLDTPLVAVRRRIFFSRSEQPASHLVPLWGWWCRRCGDGGEGYTHSAVLAAACEHGDVHRRVHRTHAYARAARYVLCARPGQVVHHIDGDATNNDPGNLRIVDAAENVRGER